MADEIDEVEVVVWRKYILVAKTAHRRAWFWAFLAGAAVAVALMLLFGHHCHAEVRPVVVVRHEPVVIVKHVPVFIHDAPSPVAAPPPVTHPVTHRVVHRVVRHVVHHCRCSCRR
jgi:hypothetical protein